MMRLSDWPKSQKIIFGLLLVMSVCWIVYVVFGHSLIQQAYDGKSVVLFNKVISGQEVHQPIHYFRIADRFLIKISFYVLLVCVLILLPKELKVSVVSVLIIIFLLEGALRINDYILSKKYPEDPNGEAILWEHDDILGWRKRANARNYFTDKIKKFHTYVQTNSKGLRDKEYSYEKAPDVQRILLLGDSVTVGLEVPENKVIDRYLEEKLAALGNYEVINAGTRGYGTDQSYLFLTHEGYKYQPDIVVYVYAANDWIENVTVHKPYRKFGKSYFTVDGQGKLVLNGVPVPKEFPHSDFWTMSDEKVERFYNEPMIIEDEKNGFYDPWHALVVDIKRDLPSMLLWKWTKWKVRAIEPLHETLVRWKLMEPPIDREIKGRSDFVFDYENRIMEKILQAMSAYTESIGARFLVYETTVYGEEKDMKTTRLKDIADKLNIEYHESFDKFYERAIKDHRNKKYFCYPTDPHWNERGHAMAAECLYNYFVKKQWVKKL